MGKETHPVTCPLCGRRNEPPLESLKEGGTFVCSFCGLKLTLHGHMWEEIRNEITGMQKEP
ncbi:MAG: hypothetical protein GXX84_10660 [Acidobacteria bacterium]|nr:hypothetical protein [Acidobacteriota bacterium]